MAWLSDRERRCFYGCKEEGGQSCFYGQKRRSYRDCTDKRYKCRALKQGLREGALDFGYAIPCGEGKMYRYYCPDKQVWEKLGYYKQDADPEAA